MLKIEHASIKGEQMMLKRTRNVITILSAAVLLPAVLITGCGKKEATTELDAVVAEEAAVEEAAAVESAGAADAAASGDVAVASGEVAAEADATAADGTADAAAGEAAATDAVVTETAEVPENAAVSENAAPAYRDDYGITVAEIFGTGSSESSDSGEAATGEAASGDAASGGAASGGAASGGAASDGAASGQVASGDAAERAKAKGLPAPPAIDVSSWQYILASANHTLPEGYGPEDVEYVGDEECPIDYRIADNLRNFTDDCEEAGYPCYLSSGYRSYDTQKEIFDEKVEEYGYDEAATIVLPPGTSEHQTGLCCDITDVYRSPKNPDELSQTETFQWLNAHSEEYGFILRYPENKEEITDVIYEPWHFRYVGEEAARYIKENDLCLEEFLALYGVE